MVVIKRLNIGSVAKVLGVLYALIGAIIGVFVALVGTMGVAIESIPAAGVFALGGIFMIILLPIFYGLIGLLVGLITAALYNFVAKWVGGIEFDSK